MHSVVWNESREQWLADCVKLDSVLNIPATSKTPMGNLLATMLEPWSFDCMEEMISAFEEKHKNDTGHRLEEFGSVSDDEWA